MLVVIVHAANLNDGRAAHRVLSHLFSLLDSVKKIWADTAYKGHGFVAWALKQFQCEIEIVKKKKKKPGFQVIPRRWVVERTFAWLSRFRRLSKEYERNPESSASMVYIASSRLMLRRICKNVELEEEAVLKLA